MAGHTTPALDADARRPTRRQARRYWGHAVLFVASVLLANALFGERGLMETIRARRANATAAGNLLRLKQQNARLREEVRRLNSDPGTIEAVARAELGLLRPGEILITVKDVK
jgi:cell division protein FtsB